LQSLALLCAWLTARGAVEAAGAPSLPRATSWGGSWFATDVFVGPVESGPRSRQRELRGRNITVNVAPGPVAEQMSKLPPLERLGQPEDIARVVSFLAGPDGGWVNGQVLRDRRVRVRARRAVAENASSRCVLAHEVACAAAIGERGSRMASEPDAPATDTPVSPTRASPQILVLSRSVTFWTCVVASAWFVGIAATGAASSWETLTRWGYLTGQDIWRGGYWSLFTSSFIHLDLWHLGFNLYWLWTLGILAERKLGVRAYAVFLLGSSFVSSAVELGVSGNTGHGASGVVYALFGLLWIGQRKLAPAARAQILKSAPILWLWVPLCILATRAGVMEVANGAHLGGLLLGLIAGPWLMPSGRHRSLSKAATVGVAVLSVVPLFWCPWSADWVALRAYEAHAAGDYDSAIRRYRRSITLGGDRLWALENIALAQYARRDTSAYGGTLAEIRATDPEVARRIESEIEKTPRSER
jgi:membrane associated rhomboid family serine protease